MTMNINKFQNGDKTTLALSGKGNRWLSIPNDPPAAGLRRWASSRLGNFQPALTLEIIPLFGYSSVEFTVNIFPHATGSGKLY